MSQKEAKAQEKSKKKRTRYLLGPSQKVVERRKKVMRLRFVKRWPLEQIAKALGVSITTVRRDERVICQYGKVQGQDVMKKALEELVWELEMNFQERMMERHIEYSNANASKNQALRRKILNDMAEDTERHLKMLQSIGAAPLRPAEHHITSETFEERIKRLRAEREAQREQFIGDDDDDSDEPDEL